MSRLKARWMQRRYCRPEAYSEHLRDALHHATPDAMSMVKYGFRQGYHSTSGTTLHLRFGAVEHVRAAIDQELRFISDVFNAAKHLVETEQDSEGTWTHLGEALGMFWGVMDTRMRLFFTHEVSPKHLRSAMEEATHFLSDAVKSQHIEERFLNTYRKMLRSGVSYRDIARFEAVKNAVLLTN